MSSIRSGCYMSKVGIVHLVRFQNGVNLFQRFLKSYLANQGGIEHDFIVLFKGFQNQEDTRPYTLLLEGISHRVFHVSDEGYDIGAYLKVAKSLEYEYFCFLNSFSLILDKDWLTKMFQQISRKGVGVVGATGSWQSIYTDLQNFVNEKNSIYRRIRYHFMLKKWKEQLKEWKEHFDPFPNYHIRSNAFMISRQLLLKLNCGAIKNKMDAYKFESGNQSLTKQVLNFDMNALVVGKDGKGYEKEEWNKSGTFWQKMQKNLLIADNQTNQYFISTEKVRQKYSFYAWGK